MNWFKKSGWFYIPTSIAGAICILLTIAFCVNTFMAIDSHSHSNTDTLYGIFPYWVGAFTILFWVASNTSSNTISKNN
jgi:hypothetical protein